MLHVKLHEGRHHVATSQADVPGSRHGDQTLDPGQGYQTSLCGGGSGALLALHVASCVVALGCGSGSGGGVR